MVTQAAERQPVLVCIDGSLAGQRHPIGVAGLVLGRGEHCDVVFEDPGVSREHARVLLHLDQVWVQDLGSRNGCFINDRRLVRHKALEPGDVLRVGSHRFTLEMVETFPEGESVSVFGATPPRSVPPVAPASSGARAPIVLAVVVSLVLTAAVVAAWFIAGH